MPRHGSNCVDGALHRARKLAAPAPARRAAPVQPGAVQWDLKHAREAQARLHATAPTDETPRAGTRTPKPRTSREPPRDVAGMQRLLRAYNDDLYFPQKARHSTPPRQRRHLLAVPVPRSSPPRAAEHAAGCMSSPASPSAILDDRSRYTTDAAALEPPLRSPSPQYDGHCSGSGIFAQLEREAAQELYSDFGPMTASQRALQQQGTEISVSSPPQHSPTPRVVVRPDTPPPTGSCDGESSGPLRLPFLLPLHAETAECLNPVFASALDVNGDVPGEHVGLDWRLGLATFVRAADGEMPPTLTSDDVTDPRPRRGPL